MEREINLNAIATVLGFEYLDGQILIGDNEWIEFDPFNNANLLLHIETVLTLSIDYRALGVRVTWYRSNRPGAVDLKYADFKGDRLKTRKLAVLYFAEDANIAWHRGDLRTPTPSTLVEYERKGWPLSGMPWLIED